MKIVKKDSKKLRIIRRDLLKRNFDDEILRSMGIHKEMNIVPTSAYKNNLKIDSDFGQTWKYGNLRGIEDVWYFASRNRGENLVNRFYDTLVELNPNLKKINAKNFEDKFAVIRGVGTGLHYNDIKYFVEDLKLDAKNESVENNNFYELAFETYLKRAGVNTEKDESEFTQEELNSIDTIVNKLSYVLSPETSKRVIMNKSYKNY